MPDTPKLSWTQPICEQDYIKMFGTITIKGGDQYMNIPMPTRMRSEALCIERCSWCGKATIFGVYLRADPATVQYPAVKE